MNPICFRCKKEITIGDDMVTIAGVGTFHIPCWNEEQEDFDADKIEEHAAE